MIDGLSSGCPDEHRGAGKENSKMNRVPPTARPSISDQKAPYNVKYVHLFINYLYFFNHQL